MFGFHPQRTEASSPPRLTEGGPAQPAAVEPLERRVFLSGSGWEEDGRGRRGGSDGDGDGEDGDRRRGGPPAPRIYAPHSTVRGNTLAEWSAEWWKWAFSQPVDDSALFDQTGELARNGDVGDVFFLAGVVNDSGTVHRTITVPSGTPIFFPVLNNECSTIEGNGTTEAELLACNDFFIGLASDLHASVDGNPVPNLTAHRETSGAFGFTLPENNFLQFFGVDAPAGFHESSVADGYWVMLKPLSKGYHEINFGGTFGAPVNFTLDISYDVQVVPKGKYRKENPPAASPFRDTPVHRPAERLAAQILQTAGTVAREWEIA